ncbi:C40 family peptidase [Nocardia panacis]|uniref:C40 family peptidase n=1 Tax=Nocardia panacis TaxID=2340916 RepID=UPI0013157200|nr:NlpC/P60 family protein [Nocardia panacis]
MKPDDPQDKPQVESGPKQAPPGEPESQQKAPDPPPSAAAPAEPPAPQVDPELIERLLPAASMAAMMGATMLPKIASALSGLGGGGAGAGQTPTQNQNVNGGATTDAEQTKRLLRDLADLYPDGMPEAPPNGQPGAAEQGKSGKKGDKGPESAGKTDKTQGNGAKGTNSGTSADKGATSRAAAVNKLYLRNVRTAFINLDNQLVHYLYQLAANTAVDQQRLQVLVHELDKQLAALGPRAFTPEGQQYIRQLLTSALQQGGLQVQISAGSSADTAAAVEQLTAQYVYNLAGKDFTPNMPTPGISQASWTGGGMPTAIQQAIMVALAQRGKQYVWGGNGPDVFDCSGLMVYAARAAGVSIPRTSQEQYTGLPRVAPQNIQPGDLIFTRFDDPNPPGHVVMYIGNNQCIAASRPGVPIGVVPLPDSFSAARWYNPRA